MDTSKRLTEGNILRALIRLALPIMGTSFIQMAYNMTDMIWIGRVGSKAVAAVGTAGFFMWFGMAFILVAKIGTEIGVAQSVGKEDIRTAKKYVNNGIQLNVILAITYGLSLILFRKQLIAFFNINDMEVVDKAVNYLVIVSLGMVFSFANQILTGIFNGYGDSKTPFIINAIGLGLNMIMDPIMIFGIGPFPELGVKGAAIATITAQFIVTVIFICNIKGKTQLFTEFSLVKIPEKYYLKRIVRLGLPVALQSGLFTIFAMFIARIIARWGPIPIAVQKVGSQIEAISWMSAGGFSSALSAFVGQNYGAKKWTRIYRGYFTAVGIVSIIGITATCLLIFGAGPIFSIFIPEEEAIKYGTVYLQILGLSQLFMCLEITTAGAFNGLGRTVPPSFVSILFTGLRVPAAMILSSEELLGLNGVWWSISISSVFKGVILMTWFIIYYNKNYHVEDKSIVKIFST